MTTGKQPVPFPALYLGTAGALPFVAAAAAALVADGIRDLALFALAAYGAVILSFLGGIRWGLAMAGDASGNALHGRLVLSVCPSLVGWAALLIPLKPGLLLMAAAFALMLGLDVAAARRGETPAWYPRLRIPLTTVVVASLVLGAMA